jgi:hypothetical protein
LGSNGVLGEAHNGTSAYGVWGKSSSGTGVVGHGTGSGATGVFGSSTGSNGGVGVWGQTSSGASGQPAVLASNESSGPGVLGTSAGGIGVYGANSTSAGGAPAVQGVNFGSGPGVVGFSSTGTGVGGGTVTGIGFGGVASGSGNGVQGQTTSGIAVEGIATGASGFSGLFTGGIGVAVNGNFTVMGGLKSAAVRGSSGSLVRLYCVESPESWFEDFGHGQLSNGGTTVQLEPGFASVVKTDDYHVFLTPYGDTKGLYVSSRNPGGFSVHEVQGGSSSVTFSYRIVAKRKDIPGTRLEHVDELPPVQPLTLSELPATPPPTPPMPHDGH